MRMNINHYHHHTVIGCVICTFWQWCPRQCVCPSTWSNDSQSVKYTHPHKMIDLCTDKFRFPWIFISNFAIYYLHCNIPFSRSHLAYSWHYVLFAQAGDIETVIYLILKHTHFFVCAIHCDIKRINTIRENYFLRYLFWSLHRFSHINTHI